jgi:hypothetical protein
MSTNTIKIHADLLHILNQKKFDKFTVKKVKDEMLYNSSTIMPPNEIREFVYKQLTRLMKLKLLSRSGVKHSHNAGYEKTKLFSQVTFVPITRKKIDETKSNVESKKLKRELDLTVQKYQSDMFSIIGEADKYQQLMTVFPHMKNELEKKSLAAKVELSTIQGKIKAINNIIVNH